MNGERHTSPEEKFLTMRRSERRAERKLRNKVYFYVFGRWPQTVVDERLHEVEIRERLNRQRAFERRRS